MDVRHKGLLSGIAATGAALIGVSAANASNVAGLENLLKNYPPPHRLIIDDPLPPGYTISEGSDAVEGKSLEGLKVKDIGRVYEKDGASHIVLFREDYGLTAPPGFKAMGTLLSTKDHLPFTVNRGDDLDLSKIIRYDKKHGKLSIGADDNHLNRALSNLYLSGEETNAMEPGLYSAWAKFTPKDGGPMTIGEAYRLIFYVPGDHVDLRAKLKEAERIARSHNRFRDFGTIDVFIKDYASALDEIDSLKVEVGKSGDIIIGGKKMSPEEANRHIRHQDALIQFYGVRLTYLTSILEELADRETSTRVTSETRLGKLTSGRYRLENLDLHGRSSRIDLNSFFPDSLSDASPDVSSGERESVDLFLDPQPRVDATFSHSGEHRFYGDLSLGVPKGDGIYRFTIQASGANGDSSSSHSQAIVDADTVAARTERYRATPHGSRYRLSIDALDISRQLGIPVENLGIALARIVNSDDKTSRTTDQSLTFPGYRNLTHQVDERSSDFANTIMDLDGRLGSGPLYLDLFGRHQSGSGSGKSVVTAQKFPQGDREVHDESDNTSTHGHTYKIGLGANGRHGMDLTAMLSESWANVMNYRNEDPFGQTPTTINRSNLHTHSASYSAAAHAQPSQNLSLLVHAYYDSLRSTSVQTNDDGSKFQDGKDAARSTGIRGAIFADNIAGAIYEIMRARHWQSRLNSDETGFAYHSELQPDDPYIPGMLGVRGGVEKSDRSIDGEVMNRTAHERKYSGEVLIPLSSIGLGLGYDQTEVRATVTYDDPRMREIVEGPQPLQLTPSNFHIDRQGKVTLFGTAGGLDWSGTLGYNFDPNEKHPMSFNLRLGLGGR